MHSLTGPIAQRFIARSNAYAVQKGFGGYVPAREKDLPDGTRGPDLRLTGSLIDQHIAGEITLGHYMLSPKGKAKLFALDIDLRDAHGKWIPTPSAADFEAVEKRFAGDPQGLEEAVAHLRNPVGGNPRELWQDKKHPSRPFFLRQMKGVADAFAHRIWDEFNGEIPVACAYSGFKGIHVYGFTGLADAADVRALGQAVIESFDRYRPQKGGNFWLDGDDNPETGFRNFEIELFPKQDATREDGYGNLMRLPLGINKKAPKSKGFFVDQRPGVANIKPLGEADTLRLLETGDPWGESW